MKIPKLMLFFFGLLLAQLAVAGSELDGTWNFEKSAGYWGKPKKLPVPEILTLQIVQDRLLMRPKCDSTVDYEKVNLEYSELFQANVKAGITPANLDNYLKKNFAFDFLKTKHYYRAKKYTSCDDFFDDVIVSKDRLIFLQGGTIYYSYVRAASPSTVDVAPGIALNGRKFSHLPFDKMPLLTVCKFQDAKPGIPPKVSEVCAPLYYPYVATKKDTDPISKLIGTHLYIKNGAKGDKDYDNPLAHNLHPVYFLLPPLKNVLVVAVQDKQQGEDSNRSGIDDLYLVIRDGQVTDQLMGTCKLTAEYVCVSDDGKKTHRLLESGKFEKI